MARLFVFGVGGTGSRVMKSLLMLLAAGVSIGDFDEVIPLLIDPHKDLPEFANCSELVQIYANLHDSIYSKKAGPKDGFFRTRVGFLTGSVENPAKKGEAPKPDISFDQGSTETFRNFIGLADIADKFPATADLLSLLYSEQNFNQPLSVGFKGNPHMGSIALNSLVGGPAYDAFISTFSGDDRIFIISSLFGGTGAAGFPLLLQNFRDREVGNDAVREAIIGALSVMPYFKLGEPGANSDIDSNDFAAKTKFALTYYARENFASLYDAIYYIGDPDGQTESYENNESKQNNSAHIIEMLGALAVVHFAQQRTFKQGQVNEYSINSDVPNVNFTHIGEQTKKAMIKALTSLHLLTKLHAVNEQQASALPYCKVNDFGPDFFSGEFFKNRESGLETFIESHYKPWIKQLSTNQRGFSPFNLEADHQFNNLLNGLERMGSDWSFPKQPVNLDDLLLKMGAMSTKKEIRKFDNKHLIARYMLMCKKATSHFIERQLKIGDFK